MDFLEAEARLSLPSRRGVRGETVRSAQKARGEAGPPRVTLLPAVDSRASRGMQNSLFLCLCWPAVCLGPRFACPRVGPRSGLSLLAPQLPPQGQQDS